MKITDLKTLEYGSFYGKYLDLVPIESDLIEYYNENLKYVIDFFESIPKNKINYSYKADKWSIIEVFQHLIDTERIFQYRCFRIARHDKTLLSGFEQDDYIEPSEAKNKSMESLVVEFKSVRQSFIVLLNSLNDNDFKFIGSANGNPMSARAAAFIVLGHYLWHINIIRERYL